MTGRYYYAAKLLHELIRVCGDDPACVQLLLNVPSEPFPHESIFNSNLVSVLEALKLLKDSLATAVGARRCIFTNPHRVRKAVVNANTSLAYAEMDSKSLSSASTGSAHPAHTGSEGLAVASSESDCMPTLIHMPFLTSSY